jgi:hypothetical protein
MDSPISHKRTGLILQILSIGAVASTFFGFIIVNIYLAFFGFWDFNFLKVQYVSAGFLFLLFTLLPATFFYVFFEARTILERYQDINKKTIKSILIILAEVIIFVALAYLSFCTFIFPISLSYISISQPFPTVLGIFWTVVIFLLVRTVIKSHKEIIETRTKILNLQNIVYYFQAHFRLLYLLFAIPSLIFIFSFIIYPVVPRYLGGGEPVTVSINLISTFSDNQIAPVNPFNAFLIYQSSDSLLITTGTGTYLLKQSDISYIKYLGSNQRLAPFLSFLNPSKTASTSTVSSPTINKN